jgi:thiol:disulfide interchange protein
MKTILPFPRIVSNVSWAGLLLILAMLGAPQLKLAAAEEATKPKRSAIYDESANGFQQISNALASAKQEGKHVMLQFGANWCGWCHKLHQLSNADAGIAAKLKSDYVVVLIDVNKQHNQEVDTKYGHPTRFGLPVIVVLDAEGKPLTTKNTSELEQGDHHDPAKVMAFLGQWAPKKKG